MCDKHPEMFVHAMPAPEAGSLERLLSELEFNVILSRSERMASFDLIQFRRAIADGTFAWIDDDLRSAVCGAYTAMFTANADVELYTHRHSSASGVRDSMARCEGPIKIAIDSLRSALLS